MNCFLSLDYYYQDFVLTFMAVNDSIFETHG